MPERAVGQNRVGTPSASASGMGRSLPRARHRRAPARDGHQRVGEPDLARQLRRLGPAAEEAVGTHVHHAVAQLLAAQRAAELPGLLEQHHLGPAVGARGATRQLPRGGEPADAPADDDHPPRHVRASRLPR